MAELIREDIQLPSDRVIVALDKMGFAQAEALLEQVYEHVGMAKGNSIAVRKGWDYTVERFLAHDVETMADPKFHDIPQTVGLEVEEITHSRPRFVTVHASAGPEALEYAVAGRNKAEDELGILATKVLGITVLTSHDSDECISIYGEEPQKKVLQFAKFALEAGLDGIVCAAKELQAIRSDASLDSLTTVVPGIVPKWAAKPSDQHRVATPSIAIQQGADYLVIGRAITQPPEAMSPQEAAYLITEEVGGSM